MKKLLIPVKKGDDAILIEVPDELIGLLMLARIKSIKMDNGRKIMGIHIDEFIKL